MKQTPVEDGLEIACLKRVIVKTKPELNLLRKEVDTMKKLANNKYVVKYYDSNAQKLEDGTYEVLLLMEYCPNKSLLDLMNQHLKTKLSTDQILKIMFEISVAVSSMHYMNLIHRDLKVENVLINANNDFKLADFGSTSGFIAPPKSQEEFQAIAHDILYQTTPQYRAPEMIDLYKNVPIDYKSDIWALGVFLYKLMYYTTPFEAQGELAILHGFFQFPTAPKYPSRLKNLIIIMLQVDVNLRPNIYQVVYELCDILGKEVPIKDYYGLGPYNFDEYAKYQQQLQIQQQQLQQQQLQQQQYQQQKMMEQELLLQQQQQQAARVDGIATTDAKHPQQQYQKEDKNDYDAPPQKLTRSTNPSTGDLQNLAEEAETQQIFEKTPDPIPRQPTGGNYEQSEDEGKNNDLEDGGLDNAEERYPSLEELDEAAVEKRFPDVDTFNSEVSHNERKSYDEVRSEASALTRSSSKNLQHVQEIEEDENAPKPGIKLSKTEAWTIPAVEPNSNIDVEGVFHKVSSIESEALDSNARKSVELGGRKSFESSGSRKSFEQQANVLSPQNSITSQQHLSPQSNKSQVANQQVHYVSPQPSSQTGYYLNQQPQPTYIPSYSVQQHQNQVPDSKYFQYQPQLQQQPPVQPYQQQQPLPQQQQFNQFDASNVRPAVRGSRNPFPNQESKNPFPTSKSTLDVNTQPVKAEKSGGNPWAEYTQSPQQGPVPITNPQIMNQNLQQKQPYSTNSIPKVSNSFNYAESPKIKITTDEKLIDIDDTPKKDSKQPKLNLDLLELDMSEPSSSADDLRLEELKVRPSKNTINQQNKKGSKVAERPPPLPGRKSSELSRINLDLEELNLDDENNEHALVDEDEKEVKHSRRSLSLNRSSSSKVSRSKSGKSRPDESRKSSFLGFRS